MSTHDCESLATCLTHPRWNVAKSFGCRWPWWAWSPGSGGLADKSFATHAEAIQYATSRAHAEALAAVQSAEGVTAR